MRFLAVVLIVIASQVAAECPRRYPAIPAADFPQDALSAVNEALAARFANGLAEGMAVAIVYDDAVVYSKGFGVTERNGSVVTADSCFMVASVSKLVTALTLMSMRDAIDLDAPISEYLPVFKSIPAFIAAPFTARQLVLHMSGLPQSPPCGVLNDGCVLDLAGVASYFNTTGTLPLYAPGTQDLYSDFGFSLLGAVLSGATGLPYEHVASQAVLSPLGMRSASFNVSDIDARAYFPDGSPIQPRGWGWTNAAGGLVCSANDLAQLAKLLNGHSAGLVSQNALLQMMVPSTPTYGFGYGLETDRSRAQGMTVGKDGSQAFFFPSRSGILALGWSAQVSAISTLKLAVVVAASSSGKDSNTANPERTATAVANMLLDSLAPSLVSVLEKRFPFPVPVPVDMNVSAILGDYDLVMGTTPLGVGTVQMDTDRHAQVKSALGVLPASFLNSGSSRTFSFELPLNGGCQNGALIVTVESTGKTVLTIPYTYPGLLGIKR